MKILILASNPRKDLNLNEEIRDLQGVIDRSRQREQFEVEIGLAVRPGDLQGLLLKHDPQIVHFCGHGTGEQGLMLQDPTGQERLVTTDALKNFFELFSDQVECVLLNACYSEVQADAIVEHINYVIGMSQEIRDDAAIAFATGFYGALGYGRSIEQSYKFGCNQIQLTISEFGKSARRSIASESQRKLEVVKVVEQEIEKNAIPEYLKPKLKRKSDLTVLSHPIAEGSTETLSSSEQVEIQLNIDRIYGKEIQFKEYRDQVREYLADRKLEEHEKVFLEELRKELGLLAEEAEKILSEEQAPIQEDQEAYTNRLRALIDSGLYPFSPAIQASLRTFQTRRELTDQEVEEISKPLLEAAEVAYQEKQRQNFVEALGNEMTLEMVFIPGGTFMMGQTEGEKQQLIQKVGEEGYQEYCATELPQHKVTVPPFFMGKFAVTQEQWKVVAALPKINRDLNPDPAHFKGDRRPVEKVSWHDAIEFCDRLSQKTGRQYRLPSEAEWEYACRAGTTTPFYCGETISTDLANYNGNYTYGSGVKGVYRDQTTDVGSFPPNAFGLYDMHGNVWEWCLDHWHENYQGAPIDGSAWMIGGNSDRRLLRGGSWGTFPWHCRSACRFHDLPDDRSDYIGFRVVCGLA